MTKPEQKNAYQKFQLERGDVQKIADRLNLGTISETSRFELGMINDVFAIGDDYVLKVNSADPASPKLSKEAAIYKALPAYHIPVPKVYEVQEQPGLHGYPYILMERCKGDSLRETWSKLDAVQQRNCIQELGRLLGAIHNLHQNEVNIGGEVTAEGFLVKENIKLRIAKIATELRTSEVLDHQTIKKLEDFYVTNPAFDFTVAPSLLHGNFVFGNIITNEDRVEGIIDWEWATFGHSEEELANVLYRGPGPSSVMGEMSGELLEAFKKGYASSHPIDPDFQKRYLAYALLYFLKVLPSVPKWTHKPEKQREYIDAVALLMKQLEL